MPGAGDAGGPADNVCKWCLKAHDGTIFGVITKFIHSILYFFAHLVGLR